MSYNIKCLINIYILENSAISTVTCHDRTKVNEFKIIEDKWKIHMKENGIQKLNFKIKKKKLTND